MPVVPKISAVNVVIDRELLPAHVADFPQPQAHYYEFRFSGFSLSGNGLAVGKLICRRISDGVLMEIPMALPPERFDDSPHALLTAIDHLFVQAFKQLALTLPHDGPCENPFCEVCYK